MSVGVSKNDVITILRPRVRILNTTSMLSSIYIVKMDTLFDIELWKGQKQTKTVHVWPTHKKYSNNDNKWSWTADSKTKLELMSTRYKTQFWQKLYRLQGISDVFSLSRCHHQDQASNKSIKEASQNSWPLWKSQMSRRKECSLPTAFILPNRWHYRAESLGRDHKMFMLIVSVNNIQIFKRLDYSLSLWR